LELRGEVRAIDLDGGQFWLRLDDGTVVGAEFTCEQQYAVTQALHASCPLRVTANAKVARSGKIKRIDSVESLRLEAMELGNGVSSSPPIREPIREIGPGGSEQEWDNVPGDLAEYLHHHLYGVCRAPIHCAKVPI
jgi:hypothetical protein